MKTRKILNSLLLVVLLPFTLFAQVPANKGYVLLYEEKFEGNKLNENDWKYRTDWRKGGNLNGYNRKENVSVADGLHIAARYEMVDGQMQYTGGGVISKHQFGYGYYETLSRPFMGGKGVHTSFWQAGGSISNNNIFEIDSYEIDSKSSVGCNNLYIHIASKKYGYVPWPHRANVPFKLMEGGWLLDAYEFTPEGVIFYDNGVEVARAEWNELTAAQAVWLTALNGTGKVDVDKLPGESTFKYFRYYAKDYPGINILPNGEFEYNQDKTNPNKPVAWTTKGTEKASLIVKGDAVRNEYKLRQGFETAYEVTSIQKLEYIMNGNYELTAMVRSSGGQNNAQIKVCDFGGKDIAYDLKRNEKWSKIIIPNIKVSNNTVRITLTSKGDGGEWLEIDDINFMKPPLPGQVVKKQEPFLLIGDPIWKLAMGSPISFKGDEKFYFFDRCVGRGDAMSVDFTVNSSEKANMTPIIRMPKTGNAGWAVQLTNKGGVLFRIGSLTDNFAVTAENAYNEGQDSRITCTYNRGTANIYANGKLIKTETGITKLTNDSTAAGRLGCVDGGFEAVGDVMVQLTPAEKESARMKRFRGTLSKIKVYNREINDREVKND